MYQLIISVNIIHTIMPTLKFESMVRIKMIGETENMEYVYHVVRLVCKTALRRREGNVLEKGVRISENPKVRILKVVDKK